MDMFAGLHMKILVKLEKLLESQDEMMNMMRTLLKSDGGLARVDLEESICEQPCATVADLNSFSESLSIKENRMHAVC